MMLGNGCKIGLKSTELFESFELKLTHFPLLESLSNEPRRRKEREVRERREKGNIVDRPSGSWVCGPNVGKLGSVELSIDR